MPDDLPPLEERRDIYAAWRTKLNGRAAANRAIAVDLTEPEPALADEWSPEALFAESRRVEAESA